MGPGWQLVGSASLTAEQDGDGQGWLRLTEAEHSQVGAAFNDESFPSNQGITVDFEYATYGGSGVDGMAFFLYDGATAAADFRLGWAGGGLGYRTCPVTGAPGLRNAYIGVGFDEYGNWAQGNHCNSNDGGMTGDTTDVVGVRGAEADNYAWLGGAKTSQSLEGDRAHARRVTITITPEHMLTVLLTFPGGNQQTILDGVALPAPPPSLKFGFVASTGGATNVHEIRRARIAPPLDLEAAIDDGDDAAAPGDVKHFTATVTNNGPNAAEGPAPVASNLSDHFTDISWTCSGAAGAGCADASGSGDIVSEVDLPTGATATYAITATVRSDARDAVASLQVDAPAAQSDSQPSNNRAEDVDDMRPYLVELPTVSGQATSGRTLTGTPGSWGGGHVSIDYQWLRCDQSGESCAPIDGGWGAPQATAEGWWTCCASAGVDGHGNQYVAFRGGDEDGQALAVASRPAGGEWSIDVIHRGWLWDHTLKVTPGGRAAVLYTHWNGGAVQKVSVLDPGSGEWSAAEEVPISGGSASGKLAIDEAGRVHVLTSGWSGGLHDAVLDGDGWSVTKLEDCLAYHDLSHTLDGDALMAWSDCDGRVLTATRSGDADPAAPTVLYDGGEGRADQVAAALHSAGSAFVAWSRGDDDGNFHLTAAHRSAGDWTIRPSGLGPSAYIGHLMLTPTRGGPPAAYVSLTKHPQNWVEPAVLYGGVVTAGARVEIGEAPVTSPWWDIQSPPVLLSDRALLVVDNTRGVELLERYLPPPASAAPTVAGTAQVGRTLSAAGPSFAGGPLAERRRQWQRCDDDGCENIEGATSSEYGVAADDAGSRLRVVVTGSGLGGSDSAASEQTAAVVDAGSAPPAPVVGGVPSARTKLTSVRFSFSSTGAQSYRCSVDGGAFAPCTSPYQVSALADGAHTFAVKGITGGGAEGEPTEVAWVVDSVAPAAPVFVGVPQSSTARGARLVFAGEPGASFECSLDGSPFAPCASPLELSDLATGRHSLQVRQIDLAGNTGPAVTASWTVLADEPAADPRALRAPRLQGLVGRDVTLLNGRALDVGCALDSGSIEWCSVQARYRGRRGSASSVRGGGELVGRGRVSFSEAGHPTATVRLRLNRRGRELARSRRRGLPVDISVTAQPIDWPVLRAGAKTVLHSPKLLVLPMPQFAPGSFALDRTARDLVAAAAAQIRTARAVMCVGFTDSVGSIRANRRLGLLRARAVCQALRRAGVRRARLRAISYGETRPRATNATPEGQAQNRRVELRIRM